MANAQRATQTALFSEADIPFALIASRIDFALEEGGGELPVKQESLAACRVCKDTGIVTVDGRPRFCTCRMGNAASRTGLLVGDPLREGKWTITSQE